MQQSPQLVLNKNDWKQVAYIVITTLGTSIGYELIMLLSKYQWNQSTTIGLVMYNVVPMLVIFAKQWLQGPSLIAANQQLQQQIQQLQAAQNPQPASAAPQPPQAS